MRKLLAFHRKQNKIQSLPNALKSKHNCTNPEAWKAQLEADHGWKHLHEKKCLPSQSLLLLTVKPAAHLPTTVVLEGFGKVKNLKYFKLIALLYICLAYLCTQGAGRQGCHVEYLQKLPSSLSKTRGCPWKQLLTTAGNICHAKSTFDCCCHHIFPIVWVEESIFGGWDQACFNRFLAQQPPNEWTEWGWSVKYPPERLNCFCETLSTTLAETKKMVVGRPLLQASNVYTASTVILTGNPVFL